VKGEPRPAEPGPSAPDERRMRSMTAPAFDRWQEVREAQERVLRSEVDETLIRANLELSPLERLRRHDRALALLRALRDAADRILQP